jgi:N-hydroxyarylamine O-acetyltransferase
MVLLVEIAGRRYIADAGFGGLTLTAPLRLEPGLEQPTPHERVRLQPLDHDLVIEAEINGAWRALYRFDLQEQRQADYEVSNWYLCNHPQSLFLRELMAARAERGRRYALRGGELTIHHTGGASEQRLLTSARDLRGTLEDLFGIEVPRGADVDTALTQIIANGVRQTG